MIKRSEVLILKKSLILPCQFNFFVLFTENTSNLTSSIHQNPATIISNVRLLCLSCL